ncbi:hypothetical protein [Chamaesiphon sp. VAR_48_metabat_403]|nr:hypothetical protein [Chamaesiphon sp. VAR_48_metabat_403]
MAIFDDRMRIAAVLFLKTSISPSLNFHNENSCVYRGLGSGEPDRPISVD